MEGSGRSSRRGVLPWLIISAAQPDGDWMTHRSSLRCTYLPSYLIKWIKKGLLLFLRGFQQVISFYIILPSYVVNYFTLFLYKERIKVRTRVSGNTTHFFVCVFLFPFFFFFFVLGNIRFTTADLNVSHYHFLFPLFFLIKRKMNSDERTRRKTASFRYIV